VVVVVVVVVVVGVDLDGDSDVVLVETRLTAIFDFKTIWISASSIVGLPLAAASATIRPCASCMAGG
jgi:hypothetical protein